MPKSISTPWIWRTSVSLMNMVFWLGQNMTWHGGFDYDAARTKGQGGIVVTGQPGIGKTYFLYYLLFRLLSEGTPVSLQLAPHILVFRDDGVYRHPQDAEPDYLPTGTWALSDAGRLDEKPCNTFLKAAGRHTAWIFRPPPHWRRGGDSGKSSILRLRS
ncbi:hypothetical protein EDB84DRAFT_317917 [Lactarius hengduanensis]|nr:hypothetical protein EDB84DRAFT_317917 [Lactarius hengduanensis]